MLPSEAMGLAQRHLELGWVTAILVLQVAMAERPAWTLNGKPRVFWDLSAYELKAVHSFLMNRKELDLQPSKTPTLAKNSVFLIELLLPRKKDVLDFLVEEADCPVREARVVIFFGAQKHPNVTEFAVGPLPWPFYMRELSSGPGQHPLWASRPMSKAEYSLLYQTLKEATKPLHQFFLDITDYSLEDCNGRCLTFTYVAPHGLVSGQRRSWFILQRYMEGHFLQPTGLEVLVDHGSTNVQDWRVVQVWYNGRFYNSSEDLAQKYAEGEVSIVVLQDPLPSSQEEPLLSPSSEPQGKFPTPINEAGPHVVQSHLPSYSLEDNTVIYGKWSFSFLLRISSGLQILNAHFKNKSIAYEVSVQEAVALYGGHTPVGMQTKYRDVDWALGRVTRELSPGIDCPDTATFLDAIHYYDTDEPVSYPRALCLFEMPTGMPLPTHFNSNFSGNFNSDARPKSHILVLRTTSTVYNYDYIWDFIFYPNGVMESKMHATGSVHSTFYTSEEMSHNSHLHSHLFGDIHTHLVHYRIDLDIAGTTNSFQTLQIGREHINQINYTHEYQAAFDFERTLPKYLVFSSPQKNLWGHRHSYHLQIHSKIKQEQLPVWQEDQGITWARYPLAVTTYQESELSSSSIYNRDDPWDPPVVFEDFIQNNEHIENKDLVAWVTVGFQHSPHSEDVPNTATPGNSVGFVLQPFNFFHGIQ
uniref:Amine oxidase n=1 Tax=Nannospalax galili TaxID=1026970 RepID=A0A8C6R8L8_NANGA